MWHLTSLLRFTPQFLQMCGIVARIKFVQIHFSSSGTIFHLLPRSRRCKAVGKTQIIDGFYAFFLILAKAASSSLDTGNFLRKPMNDKKD